VEGEVAVAAAALGPPPDPLGRHRLVLVDRQRRGPERLERPVAEEASLEQAEVAMVAQT
jgi:hypothetical protein